MNMSRRSALRAGATWESEPPTYPALVSMLLAGIAARDPSMKTAMSPTMKPSLFTSYDLLFPFAEGRYGSPRAPATARFTSAMLYREHSGIQKRYVTDRARRPAFL